MVLNTKPAQFKQKKKKVENNLKDIIYKIGSEMEMGESQEAGDWERGLQPGAGAGS